MVFLAAFFAFAISLAGILANEGYLRRKALAVPQVTAPEEGALAHSPAAEPQPGGQDPATDADAAPVRPVLGQKTVRLGALGAFSLRDLLFLLVAAVAGGCCGWWIFKNTATIFDYARMVIGYAGISSVVLIDVRERRIPNMVSAVMIVARVLICVLELAFRRDGALWMLLWDIVGALGAFVILYILSRLTKGGFGLGDVKLITATVFLSGLYAAISTLFFGLVWCVVASVVLLVTKKKGMKDAIPFGPFIWLGFITTVLGGVY